MTETAATATTERSAPASARPVLDVRNLSVTFASENGPVQAVREVSFRLGAGETLALVGESGSGKSVTSLALMRLLAAAPRVRLSGSALFTDTNGQVHDLVTLPQGMMRALRGNEMSMIFQEPMTSLNPVHRVGDQIAEAITFHERVSQRTALARAVELLDRVGIPDPQRRLAAFPHHLSGGMRQRVMIAMALACNPRVLIADEPTTALDVTVQAQILDLLEELQDSRGMAVIFITHNLGVVAEIADRVMVMYSGAIVEQGPLLPVMTRPLMPYTRGLLNSVPKLDPDALGLVPLEAIPGVVPDPLNPPPGCAFAPRCRDARTDCEEALPQLEPADDDRLVRCLHWRAIQEARS